MQIKDLQARIYFLSGQLTEAKRVYEEALGEENAKKEQNTESKTVNTGHTEVFTADKSNESN